MDHDKPELVSNSILLILDETMTHTLGKDTPDWRHAKNGLYRSNLFDVIERLNETEEIDPFIETYGGMMDMLESLHPEYIGPYRAQQRIGLTESGERVAEMLHEVMSDSTRAEIQAAIEAVKPKALDTDR